jgi:Membrane-associated apoptosis protein
MDVCIIGGQECPHRSPSCRVTDRIRDRASLCAQVSGVSISRSIPKDCANKVSYINLYIYISIYLCLHAGHTRLGVLLNELKNTHRYFIDLFADMTAEWQAMLAQFVPSLTFAENCDVLRDEGVFNPRLEGEKISVASSGGIPLTPTGVLRYTELLDVHKYREYVLFGFTACPSLLFQPGMLELFRLVATGTLFLGIYRDVVSILLPLALLEQLHQLYTSVNSPLRISFVYLHVSCLLRCDGL